jgi:hypothetical protein
MFPSQYIPVGREGKITPGRAQPRSPERRQPEPTQPPPVLAGVRPERDKPPAPDTAPIPLTTTPRRGTRDPQVGLS